MVWIISTQAVQNLNEVEKQQLQAAYNLAEQVYGQEQASTGEDLQTHGHGIVSILASLHGDVATRICGILFALPRYWNDDYIVAQFEQKGIPLSVALMLKQLSVLLKLPVMTYQQGNNPHEVLRKMLLGMASDIRLILVRLASRLQTLRYLTKQVKLLEEAGKTDYLRLLAQEALDLYSPLANRLGLGQCKWEMEDLAFRLLDPTIYKKIAKMLEEKREARFQFIEQTTLFLQTELTRVLGTEHSFKIYGRPKHIYSIYQKMQSKGKNFIELNDLRALRILVEDVPECYQVIEYLHDLWVPIAGEYDDYITNAKPNGYQSLHTVVSVPDGKPLEIQVRTFAMHEFAEYGMAAHWQYKERFNFKSISKPNHALSPISSSIKHSKGLEPSIKSKKQFAQQERINWLRQLLAWRSDFNQEWIDSHEEIEKQQHEQAWQNALEQTQEDYYIYVLTPQAKILELPKGSTALDFAYLLHTEIGHRYKGALADGKIINLETQLASGQTVQILTHKYPQPKRDWLNYAFLSRTKSKIRQGINQLALLNNNENKENKEANETHSINDDKTTLQNSISATTSVLEPQFKSYQKSSLANSRNANPIMIGEIKNLPYITAGCCQPMNDDSITGVMTQRGLVIHRTQCINAQNIRVERQIPSVQWQYLGAIKSNNATSITNLYTFKVQAIFHISINQTQEYLKSVYLMFDTLCHHFTGNNQCNSSWKEQTKQWEINFVINTVPKVKQHHLFKFIEQLQQLPSVAMVHWSKE